MKRLTVKLLSTMALIVASPFVMAAPGDPGTGLTGTPHDFGGQAVAGETTGTCTFCHTPHNAISTTLLWNQGANGNATYTWDNTLTTGATPYATLTVATNTGPSLRCLSCHDGTVGVGDIGWFNAQDPATTVTVAALNQVGNGGAMDGNHPVSMPYPLNATASTYNSSTSGASAVLSDWIANPEVNGIRMFNDLNGDGTTIAAGAGAGGDAGVECSSCHDPHNGAAQTQGTFFLRGTLGQGVNYICAKCHDR